MAGSASRESCPSSPGLPFFSRAAASLVSSMFCFPRFSGVVPCTLFASGCGCFFIFFATLTMSPSSVIDPSALSLTFSAPLHPLSWDACLFGAMTGQKPQSDAVRGLAAADADEGEDPDKKLREGQLPKEEQGGDEAQVQGEEEEKVTRALSWSVSETLPEAEGYDRGEGSGSSEREDRTWERRGVCSPRKENVEDAGPVCGPESASGQQRNVLRTENIVRLMLQEIWNVARDCKEDLEEEEEEEEAADTSGCLPSRRLLSHAGRHVRRKGATSFTCGPRHFSVQRIASGSACPWRVCPE